MRKTTDLRRLAPLPAGSVPFFRRIRYCAHHRDGHHNHAVACTSVNKSTYFRHISSKHATHSTRSQLAYLYTTAQQAKARALEGRLRYSASRKWDRRSLQISACSTRAHLLGAQDLLPRLFGGGLVQVGLLCRHGSHKRSRLQAGECGCGRSPQESVPGAQARGYVQR